MQDLNPEEALLTAGDVARLAGVHRASVHRWARAGLLPATKRPGLRGQYRFRLADVDRFLASLVTAVAS